MAITELDYPGQAQALPGRRQAHAPVPPEAHWLTRAILWGTILAGTPFLLHMLLFAPRLYGP